VRALLSLVDGVTDLADELLQLLPILSLLYVFRADAFVSVGYSTPRA
jgi:hypothetical protein